MGRKIKQGKPLVIGLGMLQTFIGIGAVPAGISMIFDPSGGSLGMSLDMLTNTPFSDFLIPGIFLLAINGIGSLIGGAASFLRYRLAGELAVGGERVGAHRVGVCVVGGVVVDLLAHPAGEEVLAAPRLRDVLDQFAAPRRGVDV